MHECLISVRKADIEFSRLWEHLSEMEPRRIQKRLFYGTLLIIVFLGSLSSVFRAELEAKLVSVVCSGILFVFAALYCFRGRRALP
jgi:hypothetical protein